jgi:hypothetical protein
MKGRSESDRMAQLAGAVVQRPRGDDHEEKGGGKDSRLRFFRVLGSRRGGHSRIGAMPEQVGILPREAKGSPWAAGGG